MRTHALLLDSFSTAMASIQSPLGAGYLYHFVHLFTSFWARPYCIISVTLGFVVASLVSLSLMNLGDLLRDRMSASGGGLDSGALYIGG